MCFTFIYAICISLHLSKEVEYRISSETATDNNFGVAKWSIRQTLWRACVCVSFMTKSIILLAETHERTARQEAINAFTKRRIDKKYKREKKQTTTTTYIRTHFQLRAFFCTLHAVGNLEEDKLPKKYRIWIILSIYLTNKHQVAIFGFIIWYVHMRK